MVSNKFNQLSKKPLPKGTEEIMMYLSDEYPEVATKFAQKLLEETASELDMAETLEQRIARRKVIGTLEQRLSKRRMIRDILFQVSEKRPDLVLPILCDSRSKPEPAWVCDITEGFVGHCATLHPSKTRKAIKNVLLSHQPLSYYGRSKLQGDLKVSGGTLTEKQEQKLAIVAQQDFDIS